MFDVAIIFALTLVLLNSNARQARLNPRMPGLGKDLNNLLFFHIAFIGIYTAYILNYGGDSYSYWQFERDLGPARTDNWFDYFGFGTVFIEFLCYIPVKVLGLSYFTGNYLFGILGFLGIRYLYLMFRQTIPVNITIWGLRVVPFLFYLPNLHFWIAGVGKDSLCFFGIAWFLYCLQFHQRKWPGMVFSFLLVFYVRPHVGIMLIGGSLAGVLVSGRVKLWYKVMFSILMIGVFYLLYDAVAKYLSIGDLNTDSLSSVAKLQASNLRGKSVGSSIDLQNYSVPSRVFTYLFRPLFFDAHDIMSLIISVENLLYFVIMIKGFSAFKMGYFRKLPVWVKSGFFVFIFSVIVFANSLSNLGIVVRMKNMTMIYFLVVFISFISLRESKPVKTSGSVRRGGFPFKFNVDE
jgi:hypothetical protein